MRTTRTRNLCAAALVGVLAVTSAQAQTIETRIGKLDFEHGVPTKRTVTKLYDEMDFHRACQAYLWVLTVVGFVSSATFLFRQFPPLTSRKVRCRSR